MFTLLFFIIAIISAAIMILWIKHKVNFISGKVAAIAALIFIAVTPVAFSSLINNDYGSNNTHVDDNKKKNTKKESATILTQNNSKIIFALEKDNLN